MEKNLLIGITIGGAAVAALYFLKNKKKKYVEVNKEEFEDTEEVKEEKTIVDSAKEKIKEAAIKMVNWIMEHKDQIEAGSAALTFATALVSLRNAIIPKKPKGMVTMNKKECDDYISEMFYRAKNNILNDFYEEMYAQGGKTLNCTDGKRQLIITTNQIGEAA
jgi:hypothetical protein